MYFTDREPIQKSIDADAHELLDAALASVAAELASRHLDGDEPTAFEACLPNVVANTVNPRALA